MALGLGASLGIGAAQELGFDPIRALGGREAGYGSARPGTLEWYIDKLKGVNDLEAINMAQQLVSMKLQDPELPDQVIKQFLQSNSREKVLGPEEYGPILNKLNQDVKKAQAERQKAASGGGLFGGGGASQAGGFNLGGFNLLQLGFFGAIGYVLFKVAKQ